MHVQTLKLCMHVHIMFSSFYKIGHIYFLVNNFTQLLCGISSHKTVVFCWRGWAARSRPLASHHRVQVWTQQLLGDAQAWWANFTTTHPTNQVQWAEFCEAFHAQHIPAGIMMSKHWEFMDLQQGNQSVYAYSKLFNHLTQFAPEQVNTDEKKYRFMNGLSTKLQEHLALHTGGTFMEFVSNAIITDDAINAHRESKKKKALASPSGSAPSKYRMVCAPSPNPLQHHHLVTYPPQHRNTVPRARAPPPTMSRPLS
jgi:hypothetical protein